MQVIQAGEIGKSIERSLLLLKRTFLRTANGSGWYHWLDGPDPGPSASAVALICFWLAGSPFQDDSDVLAFLRSRQQLSPDLPNYGGFAISANPNQPIVEATSWVVRMVGTCRYWARDIGPDPNAACQWLEHNQNSDKGWGSFRGQPSRVFLTCQALRATFAVNPSSHSLILGKDWLLHNTSKNSEGWGEDAAHSPTVFHTACALTTLIELGVNYQDQTLVQGYGWLLRNFDIKSLTELSTQLEQYNTQSDPTARPFENRLPHFALPAATLALLKHPDHCRSELVYRAIRMILDTQISSQPHDGCWAHPQNPARASIWSVWPFLEVLLSAKNSNSTGPSPAVYEIAGALLVRSDNSYASVLSVLVKDVLFHIFMCLKRYWSALVLSIAFIGGLLGLDKNYWSEKDMLTGLVIPVFLVFIQLHRQE